MSSEKSTRSRFANAIAGALGALTLAIAAVVAPVSVEPAAAGNPDMSKFERGHIISDRIFFAKDAMSESAIQAFLEKKVPDCANGYVCLKTYTAASNDRAADAYCKGYDAPSGKEKASRIIYKVAQSCGINPQVILVTLQKEQGLITKTNPTSSTYKIAMGYGCPDSSGCDANYYGFFNQVWSAARQFNRYISPGLFTQYEVGKTVTVLYHPKPANCASRTFKIENKATEILYTYTPYTPNGAALKTAYGLGDKCSSYGNRNFYAYFTDWFGSTIMPASSASFIVSTYTDVLNRTPSDNEIYGKYKVLSGKPTRTDVAASFFTSKEYRQAYVTSMYEGVLGRTPAQAEVDTWVSRISKGTVKQSDLRAVFAASNEFYATSGGTDEAFVTALYQLFLDREPEPAGLTNWVAKVARKSGQSSVPLSISKSAEAQRLLSAGLYDTYLGRSASPGEQSTWAGRMAKSNYFSIAARIMGSAEYLSRAEARFPQVD